MNASLGEVIDNIGQRSPQSGVLGIDNINSSQSKSIDNDGQQSPRSNQGDHYNMNVYRGEVIDIAGQRSPHSEDIPRQLDPGTGSSTINFSQSVTEILASLGKDGYVTLGRVWL